LSSVTGVWYPLFCSEKGNGRWDACYGVPDGCGSGDRGDRGCGSGDRGGRSDLCWRCRAYTLIRRITPCFITRIGQNTCYPCNDRLGHLESDVVCFKVVSLMGLVLLAGERDIV
jgi:hypothetical protein